MTGVDIDQSLVQRAESMRKQYLHSFEKEYNKDNPLLRSLRKTRFIHGDFLGISKTWKSYDVIICLSVSKWIHFHHGDEGMKTLFNLFWKILRSGGLLVFEPQPLKSYIQASKKQVRLITIYEIC